MMKKTAMIAGIFSLLVLVSCSPKSEKIALRGSIETSLGKLEMVEKRAEIKVSADVKEKTIRPQDDEILYVFTFRGKKEISKGEDGFPLIDSAGHYYLPVFEGTFGTDGILSYKGWIWNGEALGKDGKLVFVGTIKLPLPQVTLVYLIPKSVKDLAFIDEKDQGRAYFIIGKSEKEFQMAMPVPPATASLPKKYEVYEGFGGFAGGAEGIPDLETRQSWWSFGIARWRFQDSIWARLLPRQEFDSPAGPGYQFVSVELRVKYSGDVTSALDANDIILVDQTSDEYRQIGVDRISQNDKLNPGETDINSGFYGDSMKFYIYSNAHGDTFKFYINQTSPTDFGEITMKIGKPAGRFVMVFEVPKGKTGLKLRLFGSRILNLE